MSIFHFVLCFFCFAGNGNFLFEFVCQIILILSIKAVFSYIARGLSISNTTVVNLTLDTPVNFSLPILTFTDLVNQTVDQQNVTANPEIVLNSTSVSPIINATMTANCNRTKLLFSNLVESFESNRSLNRFHHDVDLFVAHLDNMTRHSTDRKHISWFFMLKKLVTLLNSTMGEDVVVDHLNVATATTTPASLAHKPLNATKNNTSVFPFLSITSVVGSSDNSEIYTANTLGYNMILKLIKYEYYRNLNNEDSDDEDDDDDEDSKGHFNYYKSMGNNRQYNTNKQLYY
jgi:hypothetical protein